MLFSRRLRSALAVLLLTALVLLSAAPHIARAEQITLTPGATITIDDVIQTVNDSSWIVGGQTILITTQTVISGTPVIGKKAHLVAVVGQKGELIAQTIIVIIVIQVPTFTPTFTATPQITATPQFTSTPSVTNTPTITPGGPTLTPTPIPIATATAIPYVTIVIEGPVEVIDVTIDVIVVYGQHIKLKHGDPFLKKVKLGDWVHVGGAYGFDASKQIVIIAVTIIIIDAPVIIIVAPGGSGGGGDDGHHGHHGDD